MDTVAKIDLSSYRQQLKGTPLSGSSQLGKEIKQALATTGFCYLTNHEVDETLITQFQRESKIKLFQESKGFGEEALNPERPPDLKKLFKYRPAKENQILWPDNSYKRLTKDMFSAFTELSYKFLELLSFGLDLSVDLKGAHSLIGQEGNTTTLRTHYYPPLSADNVLAGNQTRCGEHTDFGTITFLVLDEVDGLEVLIPNQGFVPVEPIPGSVIVMVGSLLQRWTSDNLIAPKHRVVIPDDVSQRSICRQSMAFFVNPDDDFVVRCLDGKDKHSPRKAADYIEKRKSEGRVGT